jgi:hypothetical protein
MTKSASKIRFKATLLRPAEGARDSSWTFLVLPGNASAALPTRGMTTVEGLPVNLSFELARGKTLARLSENSLGFRMEGSVELCAATACGRAGGVK